MADLLAARTCVPCRGGIPPLTIEQAEAMRQAVPSWDLIDAGRRIEHRYRFKDFREALAFVIAASKIAEEERHHPDISFGWGYAVVSLTTHKIKGLHDNDFILAAKYEALYAELRALGSINT